MTSQKIHFEDHGQDFLWFIVNEAGRVQDCGPFQAYMWAGRSGKIVGHKDGKQYFTFNEGTFSSGERTLNYPIVKIEAIQ